MKNKFIFKYKFVIPIVLVLSIFCLTIGYSAYVKELYITGINISFKKKADLRIEYGYVSGGNNYNYYSYNYNVNDLFTRFVLNNSDSYIIFTIGVCVYGNVEMGISEITGFDDRLDYELIDYELNTKVCDSYDSSKCTLGARKTFQLKIKYKENQYDSENCEFDLDLKFIFGSIHKITYVDISGDYPTTLVGDTLDITFAGDIPSSLVVKDNNKIFQSGIDYTYLNNRLLIEKVTSDLYIYKKDDTNKLIDVMLMNENNSYIVQNAKNYIASKAAVDFTKTATTDEGIFLTTDGDGDVYYYRGAVNDNHVIFAGFCWRIVRTTGTGGVKLIYDGSPSNGTCNNTGENTQINASVFNFNSNSPASFGYMYGSEYVVESVYTTTLSGKIIYGNDVTYNEETKEYTLVDTFESDISNFGNDYSNISSKYHYTCLNDQSKCTTVQYISNISYYDSDGFLYYLELTDGKKYTDALSEMLDESTNSTSSNAKSIIDSWYEENMIDYEGQLEDTIWCNDRSIATYGGWDKDSNVIYNSLQFSTYKRLIDRNLSLICPNNNDKFTVNNGIGNGNLIHPVGLITGDEIAYAGGVFYGESNKNNYLYTGQSIATMSPAVFSSGIASIVYFNSNGDLSNNGVNYSGFGLRPVVSLKPGTTIVKGNGSSNDPYLVG